MHGALKSIVLPVVVALLVTTGRSTRADTDASWQVFAHSDDEEWSGKIDSMTVGTAGAGARTITIDGRMRSKKTGQVDRVRWSVTARECNADAGQLVTSDMSGKYVVPFDFVKGAGTFESITAQAICNAYFNANK